MLIASIQLPAVTTVPTGAVEKKAQHRARINGAFG
jgi:hypothetical protein